MKKVVIEILLLIVCSLSVFGQIPKKDIAKKGIASSVTIIGLDEDGDPFQFGSGFVFNNEMVATNFHVIEGCKSVLITTSIDTVAYYSNELVNFDKENDIVILKVKSLSITPLSLSEDSIEIGDAIYVVGNPEGLESTFSEGIVSSIRRYDDSKLIQITAPISHGSSGGPVINEKGEVIGISVSTLKEGQNLNFAVPIEFLIKLMNIKVKPTLLNSETLNEMDIIEKEKPKIESKNSQMFLDFYNKGNEELEKENYEVAASYFKKAIHVDPNCYKCYSELAMIENNLKDYNASRQNYYQALEILIPVTEQEFLEQSFYIQNIGLTYIEEYGYNDIGKLKGNTVKIQIWDSLIAINPLAQYYERRASCKSQIQDYNGAIADYEVAIKMKHYLSTELVLSIADCQYSMLNYVDAVKNYTKYINNNSIEHNNYLIDAYMSRGECKMELLDYRGALEDFKRVLEIKELKGAAFPLSTEIYNSIGRVKLELKDYPGALLDLNKSLSLYNGNTLSISSEGEFEKNPGKAYTYYLRGFAKLYLKNKEGACNDWSKAGELGDYRAYDEIKVNCK